ncbi:hypothetical protein WDZ11_22360 (plasmid) [Roseomonas mucosa]|uniref:hypothetical protein n=1 Tax=Roseomonas mucosa TaxID=207340 RepID=UPI0030CD0E0D
MDGPDHPNSAQTEIDDPSIRDILHSHTAMLRAIREQLTALAKAVAPPEREGPPLDEMLLAIVALLREHGVVIDRVDNRTLALGTDLPRAVAREVTLLRAEREMRG